VADDGGAVTGGDRVRVSRRALEPPVADDGGAVTGGDRVRVSRRALEPPVADDGGAVCMDTVGAV